MATTVLSLFVDLYPRLMVSSTNAAYNLTVHNTASGSYALKVMTVVTVVFFPLVLVYQGWTYYVFRERVRPDSFSGARRSRRPRPVQGRHPASRRLARRHDADHQRGSAVRPLDRRLLSPLDLRVRHLAVAAAVTALAALLVLAQAFVVAELVVRPFQQGADVASLRAPLLVLAGVVFGRALLAWAAEVSAHRISAEVKSSLRQQLLEHVVRLGPAWLSGKATGEIATLATRGTDALDAYFARYLPAAISAAVVPPVVVAVVLSQDLLAGLIILATLPLVPVFAILVGTTTQRRARSRWRTLSTLGAHFLDVVEGLPTLLVFRRARAQVETIRRVTEENRRATMATLRVAFLSSAVLEFVATISVALVAVSTGLRLVGGTLDLRTGLVVIVLAPEAYWPLRQLAVHFHDSADGLAAAERVFAILDTPVARARAPHTGRGAV